MFKHMLVPLDGTPQAAAVLPAARTLAQQLGAEITLLRVLDPLDLDPRVTAGARDELARVAAELGAAEGARVQTAVRHSDVVAETIIHEALAGRRDLVVMTTHGRSGVPRFVLGSVAEEVLRNSPVPVLLLRPGGKRLTGVHRLLVPVDGTPGGALALGAAVGLARATGAQITLLQIVVPTPAYAYERDVWFGAGAYMERDWDDEALASARLYVERLASRLDRAGIQATGRALLAGNVAEQIVATADEVETDLIVASTHAHVALARAILGSVADALVRTAHRPVLLVHRDHRAPLQGSSPTGEAEPTSAIAGRELSYDPSA